MNERTSRIAPQEFLQFKKSAFAFNLTKENNIPLNEVDNLFKLLQGTLSKLELVRNDSIQTSIVIKEHTEVLSPKHKELIEVWLLKALQWDDSYVYAYNLLAQKANREARTLRIPIKQVSDVELMRLLKQKRSGPIMESVSGTVKEQIAEILRPLSEAFDSRDHIERIIEALGKYVDENTKVPVEYHCECLQVTNAAFYPCFKRLHIQTGIPVTWIAEVLHYHIHSNNRAKNGIAISTIIKNINSYRVE